MGALVVLIGMKFDSDTQNEYSSSNISVQNKLSLRDRFTMLEQLEWQNINTVSKSTVAVSSDIGKTTFYHST